MLRVVMVITFDDPMSSARAARNCGRSEWACTFPHTRRFTDLCRDLHARYARPVTLCRWVVLCVVLCPAMPASACRCDSTITFAELFVDGSQAVPIDAHVVVLTHDDHAVSVRQLAYVPVQRLELYAGLQRIEVDVRDTALEGGFHLRELVPRSPLAAHTEHVVLARADGDDVSGCFSGEACESSLGSFTTSDGRDEGPPRWTHAPQGGWEQTPEPDGESCDNGSIALGAYRSGASDDRDVAIVRVDIARSGSTEPAWAVRYQPEQVEVLGRGCNLSPLPQPTGPVTYRLRLVDTLGRTSEWSDVAFDAARSPPEPEPEPEPPPPPRASHCGCAMGAHGSPLAVLSVLALIVRRRRAGRLR
jgi:hypothetical protein